MAFGALPVKASKAGIGIGRGLAFCRRYSADRVVAYHTDLAFKAGWRMNGCLPCSRVPSINTAPL